MNYSVSLITNRPDCEALINIAMEEKGNLDYRKLGLTRQRQNVTQTSVEIEAELASVTVEIEALQAVIEGLPDGPTKDETVRKLKKSEYRKFLLEERKGNYGVLALIEKEYDIACIEKDIVETDVFIAALNDKLAVL
jgi:hypothetical protein